MIIDIVTLGCEPNIHSDIDLSNNHFNPRLKIIVQVGTFPYLTLLKHATTQTPFGLKLHGLDSPLVKANKALSPLLKLMASHATLVL
jgi:hypothetical protein